MELVTFTQNIQLGSGTTTNTLVLYLVPEKMEYLSLLQCKKEEEREHRLDHCNYSGAIHKC